MYAPSNIYTHSYLFAIFKFYDFKQGNDFKWLTFHKVGKAINENVLLVPFSQVPGFFFFFFFPLWGQLTLSFQRYSLHIQEHIKKRT